MKISVQKAALLHGILLIALFAFAASFVSEFQWVKNLSLSPLIVGIILGMIYANTLRSYLPESWTAGIKFCTKQILRFGIILYGFRLTFQQVLDIGLSAIVVDVLVICGTMGLGLLFGRMLRMDRETTLMVSTGSAICGAAAVLGAEPVVKCPAHKTAIAVSTVVIFGTLSMFLYPMAYRAGLIDLPAEEMAIYTGSTLHEVAHVVGAGNAMGPEIADMATITKMIRVMMLAPMLLIMGVLLSKLTARNHKEKKGQKSSISIPWFAFWFLVVIGIHSYLRSASFIPEAGLESCVASINAFDNFLLTMAMTALGAETSFDKFKQAGAKPFLLAGLIYVWLIVGGYAMAKWLI